MSTPTRFTSGLTQADNFQPLGNVGFLDPFFYATYEDDFLPYVAGNYTVTAAGGSVAAATASGLGGRALLTTAASGFASLQQSAANFGYIEGKQLVYGACINLDDVLLSEVIVGLINTSATPLALTDGIYFHKAAGANVVTLNVKANNVVVGSVVMPQVPNSTALINGADQDLFFVVDRKGNISGYMGYKLEGRKNPNRAALGPMARIYASDLAAPINTLPINPTLCVSASTAVARTMAVDYQIAALER